MHAKSNFAVPDTAGPVSIARPSLADNSSNKPEKENQLWDKAQSFAEWVCSRESTYRSALDLVGWELPTMLAAATRNIYSFAEATLMAIIGFGMVVAAPNITKGTAKVLSQFILKPEERKNLDHLLLFDLNDLDNQDSVEKAIERIKVEEPEDARFLSDFYQNKSEVKNKYLNKAANISEFFNGLNIDDAQRERIKKLKKAVILGESAIEGPIWGGLYLIARLFRQYVLGQNRFTGTLSYESDKDASKTGDNSKLSLVQKLGIAGAMLSAPILNSVLLQQVDKTEIKKGSWLSTIKNNWDMTHGLYPKLGLLFSYIQVPAGIGQLFSAQGKNELLENVMRLFTMVPSWWFGHRITNGVLAKRANEKLNKEFGINEDILVERKELNSPAPEPAKIQHVLKKVQDNPELMKRARSEHAKSLYAGFALHSGLVFLARMLMNYVTKMRVMHQLKKQ